MGTITVTPEEQLLLVRLREHEAGVAAFRAEATHHQAIADRFRLEGNEEQARAFEAASDASLEMARGHHAKYQDLILGREPEDAVAADAIARDAAGLAPRDSVSYGR